MSVTITPTEERVRLQIGEKSHDTVRTHEILTRWLERQAHQKGRHINISSVCVDADRDPSLRQTYLYAWADSFPDTLPDWLRTATPTVTGVLGGWDTVES